MADYTIAKTIWQNILKENKLTIKAAVEKYNVLHPENATSTQNLSNKLAKGSIRFHEMVNLMEALGYEVSIRKVGSTDIPADSNQDNYIDTLASQGKAVYVHCKDVETAKRFLADCELDGFLFDDDKKPTEKETADLFRLLPNKKMCYVGAIGHIRWQTDQDDVIKIEY